MSKLSAFLHKASSLVAIIASIAPQIPVLAPYQPIIIGIAGILSGGGFVAPKSDKPFEP